MDSLLLLVGKEIAGELKQTTEGIAFRYTDGYVGPPVFLNWPVHYTTYHWQGLPPEIMCLLPEGAQLEQWRCSQRPDCSDWGLLVASGADLPGLVSAIPVGGAQPLGREATGVRKRLNRARIQPGMGALRHGQRDVVTFNSSVGFTCSLASRTASAGAIFSRKDSSFKLVKANGSYRLTIEQSDSQEFVENQRLTAQLAQDAGVAVAPVGRVQTTDGASVLWVERFDRSGASNSQRSRVETACQLLGQSPDAKYDGSVEAIARLIRQYCTNPKIQLMRLFHRVLFAWIIGDSGLHLKKWALLQNGAMVELSPAYGLMNHAISSQDTTESALSIRGKRGGFDRDCLLEYLGEEICGLNDRIIARVMKQLGDVLWEQRMLESGLSKESQRVYFELVSERWCRLHRAPV